MKHLQTFESYNQLNEEELFGSDVYKFLSDDETKAKIMDVYVPQYITQAINSGKYKNDETGNLVDLKDLAKEDYKSAIDLGEQNKWGNPYPLLGGAPKFLKQCEPKIRKAYEYIYQRIDRANQGKGAHGFGSAE
jgi:hypothetical protein